MQRRVRVGGEGGFDYIYADAAGRRLYIPRGGQRAVAATDTTPARPATAGRVTVYDLETLATIGEIPETGGNGVVVDPKSGHGFSSATPVPMFDTRTLQKLKSLEMPSPAFRGDGIYFDAFNDRVYVFSHPTKEAMVVDPKDGTVLGTIALGGVPERWRAENDKIGMEHSPPLSGEAVNVLTAARKKRAVIGDGYVFPAPGDPAGCVSRHLARDWWERAIKTAKLPEIARMGWHSLRRKFVNDLKATTPMADLCYMGGWKSPMTVMAVYQQPDEATMISALEGREQRLAASR